MKLFTAVVLTGVLAFILGLFLPWWSVTFAGLTSAFIVQQSQGRAFLSGFLGVFLTWFLIAIWIDIKNESRLSEKVALVFPLGGSSLALMTVSALIGGVVGGFAAMAGSALTGRSRAIVKT